MEKNVKISILCQLYGKLLTEKQYEDMVYLRGEQNKFDTLVGGKELIVFGGDTNS